MSHNKCRIVCPQCGFGVSIDTSRKFVCKCGYDSTGKEKLPPYIQSELEKQRILICTNCPFYKDYRCTQIDLGCRPSFIMFVQNPSAKCPVGNW